jgi:hypothetical protein
VPSDQPAVARLVVVELKAGLGCDQWLKKRLALDERLTGDLAAVEMQEIESEIDWASFHPLRKVSGLSLRWALARLLASVALVMARGLVAPLSVAATMPTLKPSISSRLYFRP